MELSKVILYSVIGLLLLSFMSGSTQDNRNYYNRPFGYGMMSNGYGGLKSRFKNIDKTMFSVKEKPKVRGFE